MHKGMRNGQNLTFNSQSYDVYVANEVVLSKQRRADIIAVVKLKLQNEVKTKKYIKLLILIENKIGSTEHSKQTKEYVEHLSDETILINTIKKVCSDDEQIATEDIYKLFVFLNSYTKFFS